MPDNKVKIKGIWIPIHIWQMNELTVNERVLLTEIWHLEDTENKKGCVASNAFFAEKILNCSVRTVQNYLEKLRRMELIIVKLKPDKKKGTTREIFVSDRFLVDDRKLRTTTRDERDFMGGGESLFTGGMKPASPIEYNREYNNVPSVHTFTVKEWVNKIYTKIYEAKSGTRPHLTPQVYGAGKRLFEQIQSRFQVPKGDAGVVFKHATRVAMFFYDNVEDIMPYSKDVSEGIMPPLQTMTSNAVMDSLFQRFDGRAREKQAHVTQASSEAEETDFEKYGSLEDQAKKQGGNNNE